MQTDNTYSYAGRAIVHRTPMPDGRMLILAFGDGFLRPWATAFLGEDGGRYFEAREAGWQDYAKRMAEGLGLTVAPEGSVILTTKQINQVQAGAADLAAAHDVETAIGTDNCDTQIRLNAEDNIAESCMTMARLLEELGLYDPAEPAAETNDEVRSASAETAQHTTGTFVEAVTNGENWNR